MANKTIQDLNETTTLGTGEYLAVGKSDTTTKKISKGNLPFVLDDLSNITQNDLADKGIAKDDLSNVTDFSNLPDGTTTQKGVLQLATNSETITGTDTTKATTPAGVKALVDSSVAGLPIGYIKDYTLEYVTIDTVKFYGGNARSTDNTVDIVTTNNLTKDKSTDWALGDTNGGMPATVTKTGVFTTSGTAVTGTGTAFDTEFEVGDVLWSSSNAEGRVITTITDATNMTIKTAFTADVTVAENVQKNGEAPDATYHCFVIASPSGDVAGSTTTIDLVSNLSNIIGVTNGDLRVVVDGGSNQDLTNLDFSNFTNLNEIASYLDGLITGATVINDNNKLVFTSGTSGVGSSIVLSTLTGGSGIDMTGASYFDISNATVISGFDGADYGFDTSLTAVNLLADTNVSSAGLTKYRRVGSLKVKTNLDFYDFVSYDKKGMLHINYSTEVSDGTNTSNTPNLALSVPSRINVFPVFYIYARNDQSSPDMTVTINGYTILNITATVSGDNSSGAQTIQHIPTSIAEYNLQYVGTSAFAASQKTQGYIDNRG